MPLWDYRTRMQARSSPEFKSTFGTWNEYHFNARHLIGYSMKLIRECEPKNRLQWDIYYRNSGQLAKREIAALPDTLSGDDLLKAVKEIHQNHGKTLENLISLAKEFKGALEYNGIEVPMEQALNFTYIRAVDEAWIGYQRELTAENALDNYCKEHQLTWKSTDSDVDIKKGVDYEIYQGDAKLCGIQVKGAGYKKAVEESADFREYDETLKGLIDGYKQETNVPVFFMFVYKNREIENMIELDEKIQKRIDVINGNNRTVVEEEQYINDSSSNEEQKPSLDDVINHAVSIGENKSQKKDNPSMNDIKNHGGIHIDDIGK